MIIIYRIKVGDDVTFGVLYMNHLVFACVLEVSAYMNYKAKAQLFLRASVSAQQYKQMEDLLNALPDNVMICDTQCKEDEESGLQEK